jgi:hypothetical protein
MAEESLGQDPIDGEALKQIVGGLRREPPVNDEMRAEGRPI